MADPEDLSLSGDQASSDEETLTRAQDEGGDLVAQLGGDKPIDATAGVEGTGTAISHRYREIMQEQQDDDDAGLDSADAASVDAIPRRPASPMDSVLSGPDDTPSVQVHCHPPRCRELIELTRDRALYYHPQAAAFSPPQPSAPA